MTKAEIRNLPLFSSLMLNQVKVVRTEKDYKEALSEIKAAGLTGFDTETNPETASVNPGPHIIQFSLAKQAFVFQTKNPETYNGMLHILTNPHIKKVGFDLKSDKRLILNSFGVNCENTEDIVKLMQQHGYASKYKTIGVSTAVALLFGQQFKKDKYITCSRWDEDNLSSSQLVYAGNDANAALLCYHQLTSMQAVA